MEVKEQIWSFLQRYKRQVWIFTATFICGYLIHFYMFTNKFLNYFEMNNILTSMSFQKGDTVEQGKWMIPILSSVSTVYSMPAVNGIIGLLFFSLFAVLVCELLRVKSRFFGILIGLVVMTYPSIASYYAYGVNTDVLSIAPCLGLLGVWLLREGMEGSRRKIVSLVVGVFLIGLTIGAYQPFFAVAIAAVYSLLFLDVLQKGIGIKAFLRKVLCYGLLLVAAFVIYYVGLQIAIALTGVPLGDYHGVDEMTSFTLKGIAKGFVYTYFYFLRYFFSLEYANYPILIVANVLLAIALTGMVVSYLRMGTGKQKGNLLAGLLMFCLLPLGTSAAPFLMADRVGNGVDRYMMFSILFTYFLVIKLAADLPWKEVLRNMRFRLCTQWILVGAVMVTVISGAYMCNQAYYRMECMTIQEETYLNRIAARVEQTEGWSPETPVYFANCESLFNENYKVEIPQFEELTRMDGTELKPWYNASAIAKYMQVYLHFPITEPTKTQIAELEQTEAYQQMPIFPAEGSVRMIDGVMVVKIGDTE